MEKWDEYAEVFDGPIFKVVSGRVVKDDGSRVRRDVVKHPGSVAIVTVVSGCILFVEQFRISVQRPMLEIPAGRIEAGEDPSSAAKRELIEELGYEPNDLIPGPSYYSTVGFVDEIVHIFISLEPSKIEDSPEEDEDLIVRSIPLADAKELLAAYKFNDSKTIIGLHTYFSNFKL